MQTCNGFHQSPIDVSFAGTPVDDASNADNGALTFNNYNSVRTYVIENTPEHYDNRFYGNGFTGRADENKLKNKGGKTVVSKVDFFILKQSSKQIHKIPKDCK